MQSKDQTKNIMCNDNNIEWKLNGKMRIEDHGKSIVCTHQPIDLIERLKENKGGKRNRQWKEKGNGKR